MSNREIQRQRMYGYFINACHELIREEGMDQLTIRKISEKAGYNSATLYNYFENLNQLVSLALLDNVKPYFYTVKTLSKMDLSTSHLFLLIWREYARYSFENPQIFTHVFESNQSTAVLQHIDTYFEYFPSEHFSWEEDVYKFVFGRDMKKRDEFLLQPAIESGVIKAEHAIYLKDCAYAIHLGMCDRIINGYYSYNQATLQLFMNYIIDFFLLYSTIEVDKESLLTEIMAFEIKE